MRSATRPGRRAPRSGSRRRPSAATLGGIAATKTPGRPADWTFELVGAALRVTSVSSGKQLVVNSLGRLAQGSTAAARWTLVPAQGCAAFPEVQVNVTGQPSKG